MSEANNEHMNAFSNPENVPLDHFEFGSLEKVDPVTGIATVIFPKCLLTHCREGRHMSVSSEEGTILTSIVVERRVIADGYEVRTINGTTYRFTCIKPESKEPTDSVIGRLRHQTMKLLHFWKKDA